MHLANRLKIRSGVPVGSGVPVEVRKQSHSLAVGVSRLIGCPGFLTGMKLVSPSNSETGQRYRELFQVRYSKPHIISPAVCLRI